MTQDTRPNVLFIQSDQHCAAVTGCYGDPVVQTPNLDRLAARGVVMDSAYCASPICVPSRSSLLTGRHPFENRVWTNMHMLDSAIPTMAHAMGAAGYRPVQVGRLHFNGPDQLHGYAERFVGDHGPNYAGGAPVDHGSLVGTTGPHRVSLHKSGHGQSAYEVHDEHVIRTAVDLIEGIDSRKRDGEQTAPFSISLGLMLPHQPYVARERDYDMYRGTVPMPSRPEPFGDAIHPYLRWWREQCGIAEVTRDEVLRARTAYWALVTRMDAMIGDVLDALERSGLSGETLVVYTSDHGDLLGEHGLWWKQTFYEESVRVPMVLSWPDVLPQGSRCARVVSHMDLNATVLDAIGAPELPRSRGRSFLGLLRESGTPWDDVAFSEYCTDSTSEALAGGLRSTLPDAGRNGWQHRMVRRGDWKLVYYRGMEPQLFNLKEDPGEMHDLAADPGYRTVRNDLVFEVLEGWDPEAVALEMAAAQSDLQIMKSWAQNVQPPDTHRWGLRPEMSYLDPEGDLGHRQPGNEGGHRSDRT